MSSQLSTFKVDLHTHPIPEFYREALIDAGHDSPAVGGVFVDGWRTPDFSVKEYIQERIDHGYDYSILSVTAPGVSFLNGNSKAKSLARRLNDEMAAYSKSYPNQLGFYTNYDGNYVGHASLEPILAELERRKVTVFVHPTNPPISPQLHNVSLPVIEYPFDTTRAITNLLFSRSQKKFPNIRWIWSHGGGALPYLGARIAIQLTFPWAGGYDYDEAIEDMKAFYHDTAAVFTDAQLAGLAQLVGIDQIVTGSDSELTIPPSMLGVLVLCRQRGANDISGPYTPYQLVPKAQAGVANHPEFSDEDRQKIGWRNTFKLFPSLYEKFPDLK